MKQNTNKTMAGAASFKHYHRGIPLFESQLNTKEIAQQNGGNDLNVKKRGEVLEVQSGSNTGFRASPDHGMIPPPPATKGTQQGFDWAHCLPLLLMLTDCY